MGSLFQELTQPDSKVIILVKVVVSGIIIADVAVIVIGSGTHCPSVFLLN